jgi:hypothetical protein
MFMFTVVLGLKGEAERSYSLPISDVKLLDLAFYPKPLFRRDSGSRF